VVLVLALLALLGLLGLLVLEPSRLARHARSLVRKASARWESVRVVNAPPMRAEERALAERVFDSVHGMGAGWLVYGWSPHRLDRGAAGEGDLSGRGGLIFARPGLAGGYGGFGFRCRAPEGLGDFLELRLGSAAGDAFPRVRLSRGVGVAREGGFLEYWVPLETLDPRELRFDRIVLRAWRPLPAARILFDDLAFTVAAPRPPRVIRWVVDCTASPKPIDPRIYGVAGLPDDPPYVWSLGASARRWGGDSSSRYNWQLGNVWNLAYDWYFRNVRMSRDKVAYQAFLTQNESHGVRSALVMPMLGWVAKDSSSYSFPVSRDGAQHSTAWDLPDAGDGIAPDGRPLPSPAPTTTSVASTPETIERWVRAIGDTDGRQGRSVDEYILDNEPMSWAGTHRDVHPNPVTYDELLDLTIRYASAVRRADPHAVIAGPAEAGWVSYHYSAADMASSIHWDRLRHGGTPLIPWYLRQVRETERKTGTHLLDVLDVHWYSSAPGVGVSANGDTDAATCALRIRQTRALWDPTYVDESWLAEPMAVLPLMRRWIAENDPGLALSIGEWSFGAEGHMSGGLATAEALGRFGLEGVSSAYYWYHPAERSPTYWAFRAYRDFDGAGGKFLDRSVPVSGNEPLASLFASRDSAGSRVVAVLLNHDPHTPLASRVHLDSPRRPAAARAFTYAGGAEGFRPITATVSGNDLAVAVAPYSITVLDVAFTPPAGSSASAVRP
jgi:hypothetical protein